ncbi:MAG: adenylyl-sulfate kinase [Verrucomicrobium sp.]|nr:adenylyl-sulfate kinase [Verrucomicrobium sp.]
MSGANGNGASGLLADVDAQRLKIVIVGHVDHGKSTLIGRLFFDTHSLPDGKVEAIRKACEAEGMDFEYAFLLDALLEEQEQNITIDTTQIQFRTQRRPYVIIDAPGHKEFLKNMITGAASADAAILLIDAKEGVQEQSRRHGFLLSLLGVRQVIVAVNKMDLVGFSQERFEALEREYREFLGKLDVVPAHFIPVSAKHGHHITGPSAEMPWYRGPAVLQALDAFALPASRADQPLRVTVQDVYRFDARRIIAGRVESGSLSVGDEVVFWPDRKRSRVKSLELWGSPGAERSVAGQSTAFTLEEQIFVERGQIASHPQEGPIEGQTFSARLFWLHEAPLRAGASYPLRLGTQEAEARIVRIERVVDSGTLEVSPGEAAQVRKNEVAEVTFRTRRPIAFDNVDRITETGRFVLLQGDRIGGGGIIHGGEYAALDRDGVRADNLGWTEGEVTPEARRLHFGHRGAVLWLTGLSGSGKSTLASRLERALFREGIGAFVLDGDNLRHGLASDLGFSEEDRAENIRRAGEVAKLMAEAGLVVVVSLISPFRTERQKVRHLCHEAGIPFAEVYVNAPLEACEARDPKGLYKKARAGQIPNFTGIDSPYEPPAEPELELKTAELSPEDALRALLDKARALTRAEGGLVLPGGGI